MANIC